MFSITLRTMKHAVAVASGARVARICHTHTRDLDVRSHIRVATVFGVGEEGAVTRASYPEDADYEDEAGNRVTVSPTLDCSKDIVVHWHDTNGELLQTCVAQKVVVDDAL